MPEQRVGRLSWTLLEPFGAAVAIDTLRAPLDDDERDALARLLFDQGCLELADQHLRMEEQQRFTSCFGPRLPEGHETTPYIAVDADEGGFGRGELNWHRDLPYAEHPFSAISLHAVDVRDGETWTGVANTVRAYERLPAGLRARLDGLRALTVFPIRSVGRPLEAEVSVPGWPSIVRPLVGPHPVTGRPVIMACPQTTVRIVDLDADASEALLEELFEHITAPGNVYRHVWRNGDVFVWDNVTCFHGRGSLESVTRRTIQRVTVGKQSFRQAFPDADLRMLLTYNLGEEAARAARIS